MAPAFSGYVKALNRALSMSLFGAGDSKLCSADEFLETAIDRLARCRRQGGRVMVIGNGGSQAIASHMTTDMVKSLSLPAVAFSDPSNLTCLSNDYGYDAAYAHQVALFAGEGDILIAISSSGQSANIVNAIHAAKERNVWVLTMTGFSPDNPVRALGDLSYYVPVHDYGYVELSHGIFSHALCDFAALAWAKSDGGPVTMSELEDVA